MHFTAERRVLTKKDPTLRSLFARTDFSQFTIRESQLYPALVRAIAHQMVHGNAAKACLRRLMERTGNTRSKALVPSAAVVAQVTQAELRQCGFSENKSRAIFELTQKVIKGEIPTTRKLKAMSDADIVRTLVPLRGIGQWTVEMYLIFSLGRSDVFPVDDFGVREGYRIWKGEKKQRTPRYLRIKARQWSPYSTLVARALWQESDRAKVKKHDRK
ncbi:MAG: hypothetical protein RI911_356 [Candidatus Parcubacteria bacterium]|jgi:DNA-3-methyladenine glycosylase II